MMCITLIIKCPMTGRAPEHHQRMLSTRRRRFLATQEYSSPACGRRNRRTAARSFFDSDVIANLAIFQPGFKHQGTVHAQGSLWPR